MSNIMTKYNLGKNCCFCCNEGEFNLLEYKVIIKVENDDAATVDDNELEDFEFSATELLNIFQDVDISNVTKDQKLICQSCLEGLISCYKFYKKIKRASMQKERFYDAAQTFQVKQRNDSIFEVFESEEGNYVDDGDLKNVDDSKGTADQTPTKFFYSEDSPSEETQGLVEIPNEMVEAATTPTSESFTIQLDSSVDMNHLNEPFVDEEYSDQNSMLENDNISSTESETVFFDENIIYQPDYENENDEQEIKPTEQKRPRLKFLREKLAGFTGSVQPAHEDAFLVVGQFNPVKTQMCLQTQLSDNESSNFESGLGENRISTQDLSTVDYTAVEIKGSNFQQVDNGELELENQVNCHYETNRQIFVCKYCPNAFSAATYLIAHLKNSHVCKYCTQAFVKTHDLFTHIRQKHQHQHKCAICQKELSSQSSLRGHLKRLHGIHLPAHVTLLDYKLPNRSEI